jgi:hypothetical protein
MGQKKDEKRVMVHVYLTSEEKSRIEEEAAKLGISVSAYIKVKLFSEK